MRTDFRVAGITYEAVLRSKEKTIGPDRPREFGGMEPGLSSYSVKTVTIANVITDGAALKAAKRLARENNMNILLVTKNWRFRIRSNLTQG